MRANLMIAALLLASPPALAGGEFAVHTSEVADRKAVIATVEPVHRLLARARIGGTIASLSVKEGDSAAAGAEIAVVADPKLVLEMQGLPVTPNLAARGGLRLRRAARARRSPRLVHS